MAENLIYLSQRPHLRQPHLIIAFSGWSDAGEIATGALRYAISKTRAIRMGAIGCDPFYDFTTLRPLVSIEEGEAKSSRFPTNDLFFRINEMSSADFIFFLATEPHLRWELYCAQLHDLVERFEVSQIVSLGSMFDNVPHTREARVSGMASSEYLRRMLQNNGVTMLNYQGPGTINSHLHLLGKEWGVDVVSLWGHAPLYVRAPANPHVCWSILSKLSTVSPLGIDLTDLHTAGEFLTESLNKLLAENDAIRSYVQRLEEQYEYGQEPAPMEEPTTVSEGDADQIIRDVEDFLRREQRKHEEQED